MVEVNNSHGEPNSNDEKPTKKDAAKEVGKDVSGKMLEKGASKLATGGKTAKAATGGTNPAGTVATGALDAGQAIKNKDGMGVVDAGVKTGAVVAATAYGTPVAGAAVGAVLDTKVGKKTTRLVSRLIIASLVAPIITFFFLMIIIAGAASSIMQVPQALASIFGGDGGSPIACSKVADLVITEPAELKKLEFVVQEAKDADEAVLGVMTFLVNEDSIGSDPTKITNFFKEYYKKARANDDRYSSVGIAGRGGSGGGAKLLPWDLASVLNSKENDTKEVSDSAALDYAYIYPFAYWTVDRMSDPVVSNMGTPTKYLSEAEALLNNVAGVSAQCDPSENETIPGSGSGSGYKYGDIENKVKTFGDAPPPLPAKLVIVKAVLEARVSSFTEDPSRACGTGSPEERVCKSLCNRLSAAMWGVDHSGYPSAAGPTDKFLGPSHWTWALENNVAYFDKNPPIGAVIFWHKKDYGSAPSLGHSSIYLGDDYVISNWGGASPGSIGPNRGQGVYKMKISVMADAGYNYLGWAMPIFNKGRGADSEISKK